MTDQLKDRNILFLIQLPPPVHGVSIVNKMVWDNPDILPGWNRKLLELKFSSKTSQLRSFGIVKIWRFILLWFRLFGLCISKKFNFAYFTIYPTGPGFFRDIFYVTVLKLFGVMPVYHIHLTGIEKAGKKRLMNFLYRWTFSNAVIIHPSGRICQSEFKNIKLRNTRIFTLPNGILTENKPADTTNTNGIRIVYISHLYRFKGLDILLDVFQELVNSGQDLYLDIIGEKADRSIYNLLRDAQNDPLMKERINWHGLLTGELKNKILGSADLMAFTSLKETFPLVILEAMQFGIPVIASDVGAIRDILEHQETGLVFEPGNKKQLMDNIMLLISDPKLKDSIGKKAADRFHDFYTVDHFKAGMKKIFESHVN
ncbi:glycosyltransferase family 4 protein [Bacteroidota bacterium]